VSTAQGNQVSGRTMLTAITDAPSRMTLRRVPVPTPGPGQALIRVEAVGLCGSDYHLFDGTHPYARFPQVQGHEFVGIVEALGPAAGPPRPGPDAPEPGTRVAVEPLIACGGCYPCRRGRYNCCTDLKVMGAHVPGALAEYVVVPAGQLYGVGELPALTAVLTEPVSIGLQCIVRAEVGASDSVVVLGAGPIGLAAALAAVDRGAPVLVADRVASRLDVASRLGAATVVDTSRSDLAEATASFSDGDGAAVVIEATGVPALVRTAIDVVAHSGRVVVVGISTDPVSIPVIEFSRKEITILGSRNNAGVFGDAAALVSRHQNRVASLVTHSFALAEAPQAIEFAAAHPELVEKAAIVMDGASA
jgi:L-gulonate 5-dehydrogenase